MWYYIEIYNPYDSAVTGACFIEPFVGGEHVASLTAEMRGYVSAHEWTRIVALPELSDQIPDEYLDTYLTVGDLRRLDVYMGGDGSGTVPASERVVPWG